MDIVLLPELVTKIQARIAALEELEQDGRAEELRRVLADLREVIGDMAPGDAEPSAIAELQRCLAEERKRYPIWKV